MTALVVPLRIYTVRAGVSARLDGLLVSEGSEVEMGDPVASLERLGVDAELQGLEASRSALRYQVEEAQAMREVAEDEYSRTARLARLSTIDQAALVASKGRARAASARLRALEWEAAEAEHRLQALLDRQHQFFPRAPAAGVVIEVCRSEGEFAREGDLICRIASRARCLALHVDPGVVPDRWHFFAKGRRLEIIDREARPNPDGTWTVRLQPPGDGAPILGTAVSIELRPSTPVP